MSNKVKSKECPNCNSNNIITVIGIKPGSKVKLCLRCYNKFNLEEVI